MSSPRRSSRASTVLDTRAAMAAAANAPDSDERGSRVRASSRRRSVAGDGPSASASSKKKKRAQSPRRRAASPAARSSRRSRATASPSRSRSPSPAAPAAAPAPRAAATVPARRKLLLDSALAQIRHEAELGKKQIGFHNDQYIEDISVEFLYKPHTVTALLILVGVLLFMAFQLEASWDMIQNLRYGAGAACLFVLILGLLIFPSGPFIRPHPLVWRFAFGVAVIYEIWLIVILFQTKDNARQSMRFFDESLGQPVEERSYAADCTLNWENLVGACDRFVISHFLGWVVKALILRDPVICWVISLQWELIEILFQHMLPNFAECWWDQWILDVVLANGLGIYCGCKLATYLEMKEYKWGSYSSIPSYLGKMKRTVMQFTPSSWTKVQWKSTSSISRLLGIQVLIVAMHLEELNAFFLKYLLWVPPECKLNLIRLLIWAMVGVPSLRQIYSYMTDPRCKRIGHQTFLALLILITELIVIYKLGQGEFTAPMPRHIRLGLTIYMIGYVLILAFLALRSRGEHSENEVEVKRE